MTQAILYIGVSQENRTGVRSLIFTFCCIDDVLSLNIPIFHHIYPIQVEIPVTKYTAKPASYLDLHTDN